MTLTKTNRSIDDLISMLVSWVFHPVFQPVMFVAFLIFSDTSTLFLGFDRTQKWLILGQAFTLYTFFPLVTVGLLKALGFLESIQLHTQRDRVIPLVASGVWYFWIWYVWKNLPDLPMELVRFAMAAWTVSWIILMINTRLKISLHTTSAGLILGSLFAWGIEHTGGAGVYLTLCCLLAGAIGAARLRVSTHREIEIYIGYGVGLGTMLLVQLIY